MGQDIEIKPWNVTTVAPRPTSPKIMSYVNPHRVTVHEDEAEAILGRWAGSENADARRVRAAYQALEEGRQMVSLRNVLMQGVGGFALPALAVARADMSAVSCIERRSGVITFQSAIFNRWVQRRLAPFRWRYELHTRGWDSQIRWKRGVSTVPVIPADVRPEKPSNYLIVWEPTWRKQVERFDVHIDPALLEQVIGDLYVVTAAWELTPLEAAALGGG